MFSSIKIMLGDRRHFVDNSIVEKAPGMGTRQITPLWRRSEPAQKTRLEGTTQKDR